MNKLSLVVMVLFISLTASSQTYYIVRHAEKAVANGNPNMNATDPPLTDGGKARAEALKEALKNEKLGFIFSTNTIRTKSTAEPLSQYLSIPIQTYNPRPDSLFIQQLRLLKHNALIVGHSNTVDDIVNMLTKEQTIPKDLDDSEYDNLFIVRVKGDKVEFERKKYGAK
ncbi:MAG: phosphoglycerate mutase family protein [Chitinophagaceae bacterium]